MEICRATNAFKVPFLEVPAWREKSLHQRSSQLKGPVKQGRQRLQSYHPSTPWVPPSVAAESPSFPQPAARNLLFPMQHMRSISECSLLQTNLQDLPQHPQKVCSCRPGAEIKQKLLLEVIWPGHHFSVPLIQLMFLSLAMVTSGAPRRLLWPWRGKVSPWVILGHRLSVKGCSAVVEVLLFPSPSLCGVFWCSLRCPPSLACQRVPLPPAGAVPSWAVQLEWWGQDVGAAPVPAAPSHREVSTGWSHICWRGHVSAASPWRVARCPYSCTQAGGSVLSSPRAPWEGERAWGCSRGGDRLLLCSVWGQQPVAQKGHSSGW